MLLVISYSKKLARRVADNFYYMGLVTYAATPHEAFSEMSSLYRAVLVVNPEQFPDIYDYMRRLRSYNSRIPVFAYTAEEEKPVYDKVFERTFVTPELTSRVASRIVRYCIMHNLANLGHYACGGFNASCYNDWVDYLWDEIELTRTETMILRYLIINYPNPKSAAEIAKYAFRSSKSPAPESIRTYISGMNKKCLQVIGRKQLIFVPKKGYLILTPEYTYYNSLKSK